MARKKKEENTGKAKIAPIGADKKSGEREISAVCRSIRRYRESIKMEQKELAKKLGVPASAVSNWETGFSKPNLNMLYPICEALDITLYELFDIDDPLHRQSDREQQLLSKYRGLSEGHKYAVDRLVESLERSEVIDDCPDITELVYFTRSLAAGIGDPNEFDDEGEPIFLYSSPEVEKADCVFSVNGNSMEPMFHDGDMVLVQRYPNCSEISDGEIGAFIIGNETYVKEYRSDGLHSLNKRYKTMKFNDDDSVYFIGKVIARLDESCVASQRDIDKYFSVHKEM